MLLCGGFRSSGWFYQEQKCCALLFLLAVAFLLFNVRGSLVLGTLFSIMILGEEGARWTSNASAEFGWEEIICHQLSLQWMGQAVLPRSSQVRELW